MFKYWHRLENSPSNLLQSAYNEHKIGVSNNTWYSNISFFSEKLNLDLSFCKRLSKYKFKSMLKKHLKEKFIAYWKDIKTEYILYLQDDHGKLNTYFKYKSIFQYEEYQILKT